MKQITILSGKGGTGKTTITASFAVLAKNAVVADCDVDAPDLHILLHPQIIENIVFKGSKLAVIDKTECTNCELCREKCRSKAIKKDISVDSSACEGCGVCTIICPTNAITLVDRTSGHAYISRTEHGFMAHALLSPGEANSGKLVTVVRQNAKKLAEREHCDLVIIDGPPGIGCPVIASVAGVTAGLVVTEPTMSGIHDLKRALQLLRHFSIRPLVCINMYDINRENSYRIENFCKESNIEILGRLPYNQVVTEAMVNRKPVVEYAPRSDVAREIAKTWEKTLSSL